MGPQPCRTRRLILTLHYGSLSGTWLRLRYAHGIDGTHMKRLHLFQLEVFILRVSKQFLGFWCFGASMQMAELGPLP